VRASRLLFFSRVVEFEDVVAVPSTAMSSNPRASWRPSAVTPVGGVIGRLVASTPAEDVQSFGSSPPRAGAIDRALGQHPGRRHQESCSPSTAIHRNDPWSRPTQ